MSELKPCPFCGGNAKKLRTSGDERDGYADRVHYVCTVCACSRGAVGDSSKGGYADNSKVEELALAAWNTRVNDALAAQRDEGLAREAELRAVYESQNKDYIQSARIAHGAVDYDPSMMMPLANKVASLQQSLAEAVALVDRALLLVGEPSYSWMADAGVFMATHSPGCADGEKS